MSTCVDLDGGSIIGISPHPAGEQLWDGWSGEARSLDWNLCLAVHGCVCVSVTIWLEPDTGPIPWAQSLAAQLCIKQYSFHMTWWQYCGSSSQWPLRGAPLLTLGASQPPTYWCFLGPWLAPHLVLRGAGVIPQELIAHLVTVGNTWPFLQGEEDEEEGQKEEERGETEESRKRKQVGKYVLVVFFMQKHNRHFLSTRAP